MKSQMKAICVAAIFLVSCLATVGISSMNDASPSVLESSSPEYWGYDVKVDNIDSVLEMIHEQTEDFPVSSVDELKEMLVNIATSKGFDPEDISLDIEFKAGHCKVIEKEDEHTYVSHAASKLLATLDLMIPMSVLKTFMPDADQSETDDTDVLILHDYTIELDKTTHSIMHLNDDMKVDSYRSHSVRAIHLGGMSNFDIVNGEPYFGSNASNEIDCIIVSSLNNQIEFGDGGLKFLPDSETDTGWEVNIPGHVMKTGTIHYDADGDLSHILDLIAEYVHENNDGVLIDPNTHSGFILAENGIRAYDFTCEVKTDADGDRYVDFTSNNESPSPSHPPFYNPFEAIIDGKGPFSDLSALIGNDMSITPAEAQSYKDKIHEVAEARALHTDGLKVNVTFIGEDVVGATPLKTMEIDFGSTVDLDVNPPIREGQQFTYWTLAGTDGVRWDPYMHALCDLYLVPHYGVAIHQAPTQADFDNNQGLDLIWSYDVNESDGVFDASVLKANPDVDLHVRAFDGDKLLYKWKFCSDGLEAGLGEIDTTMYLTDAPEHVAQEFREKAYTYVDLSSSTAFPYDTHILVNVGDIFGDETILTIYADDGDSTEFVDKTVVKDGMAMLHMVEPSEGLVLVSNDDSKYWGGEHALFGMEAIFEAIKERNPDFEISTVEDLEDQLKELVESKGCNSDNVVLELDMDLATFRLGEAVRDNTVIIKSAGCTDIKLEKLVLPAEFIGKLIIGDEFEREGDVIFEDVTIEIDKTRTTTAVFNDKGYVLNFDMMAERTIKITGYTNVDLDEDGNFFFSDGVDVELDHLMTSNSAKFLTFGGHGLKFLPDGDETEWTIEIPVTVFNEGTIDNDASGFAAKLLDVLFEQRPPEDVYPFLISLNHSGFVMYDNGELDLDFTCNVKTDADGNRYVEFTDNSGYEPPEVVFPFFAPLAFIMGNDNIDISKFPKMFGQQEVLTENEAAEIIEMIRDIEVEHIDANTKDVEVDIIFVTPGSEPGDEPIAIQTVPYGYVGDFDVELQLEEGEIFMGWTLAGTEARVWLPSHPIVCDTVLEPIIGKIIDHAPTAADVEAYPDDVLVWIYDKDSTTEAEIDWALLKENAGKRFIVISEKDGEYIYRWTFTSDGNEAATGSIDTLIHASDAPAFVEELFAGKDMVYLDFSDHDVLPKKTSIGLNITPFGDSFNKYVDVYHVHGDELILYGSAPIINNHVVLYINECEGYLLVPGGTVPDVPVTGVELDSEAVEVIVGGQIVLGYDVLPGDAAVTDVTWTSSDPEVATVDASGRVIALETGTTTITVTTVDGGFTDSCVVTVAPVPERAEDWGFEMHFENLDELLSAIKSRNPDFTIESLEDIEDSLKNLAENLGCNPDDVVLTFDVELGSRTLFNTVDENTVRIQTSGFTNIDLDISLPRDLLAKLVRGEEYVPSDGIVVFKNVHIDVDKYRDVTLHFNERGNVIDMYSFSERAIQVAGTTNLRVEGTNFVCDDEAKYDFEHLMISTMTQLNKFGHEGFKIIPDDPTETGWNSKVDAHIVQQGTIHNEATGFAADLLELMADLRGKDPADPLLVNPLSHSGFLFTENSTKEVDYTFTIEFGEDGRAHIKAVDNNADPEVDDFNPPFFKPISFLMEYGGINISSMASFFGPHMSTDPEVLEDIQEHIDVDIDYLKDLVKDVKVNVYYVEPGFVPGDEPIAVETVSYGDLPSFDADVPLGNGEVFIGWELFPTGDPWPHTAPAFCDLVLVPAIGKVVDHKPIQSDFDAYPDDVIIWNVDIDSTTDLSLDWDLLKANPGRDLAVVVTMDGEVLYRWMVTSDGTEPSTGTLDFGIIPKQVPADLKDMFPGKDLVYLDFAASGKMPSESVVSLDLEPLNFAYGDTVDVYHISGSNFHFVETVDVMNSHVILHIFECSGYVLVGEPAEHHVTDVELNTGSLEIEVGSSATLVETVHPIDADDKSVIWSSSDESVATVDFKGKVTAVREGTATITVTTVDGGFTASCTVTVTAVSEVVPVTGVALDRATASVAVGDVLHLKATVSPGDASTKAVTWASSDDSIAFVDSNGVVKGVKAGTATITVTTADGGFTASCEITVDAQSSGSDNTMILIGVVVVVVLICAALAFVMLRRRDA